MNLNKKASCENRHFGTMPDGREVRAYVLNGGGSLEVEILTLGGIVSRIMVPDREGHLADVALGFETLKEYLREAHYFGAITGRVAGRIGGGQIEVDGVLHRLALNNEPNHLHGGNIGLDRRLWSAQPSVSEDAAELILRYHSPDGEEGYPGNVDFTVTYTVTRDNALLFTTEAITDKITPVSLTNHTYFHLGGEGTGTIEEHCISIASDTVAVMDGNLTLQGQMQSVAGQACDLRQAKQMGAIIPQLFLNHGDTYRIEGNPDQIVACVTHPPSGRMLTVQTSCPYLQFYTSMHFDGSRRGKSGQSYVKFGGFCLECEGYAEGVRFPGLGNILVHPGEPQRYVTLYRFGIASSLTAK
jgi:aldose 1-epimerase